MDRGVCRRPTSVRIASLVAIASLATSIAVLASVSRPSTAVGATPMPCSSGRVVGAWQVLSTPEAFDAYAVDPLSPWRIVAVTKSKVYLSDSAGCTWRTVFELTPTPSPEMALSSQTAQFASAVVLAGHGLLVTVADGARTRVLGSDSGEPGTWGLREQGLPPAGVATAFGASSTVSSAYLAVPTALPSPGGGPVPLPAAGDGPVDDVTIYASADGGRSWTPRPADGLAGTVRDLLVEEAQPAVVYGRTEDGRVWRSSDGGARFRSLGIDEATAMTTFGRGGLAVFGPSIAHVSTDGGASFARRPAPGGVRSAASRPEAPDLLLELENPARTVTFDLRRAAVSDVSPTVRLDGPLRLTGGRVAGSSTFQALSGSTLLRYVDTGDAAALPNGARPPVPGVITPGDARIEVANGKTKTVEYQLALPRNVTPLDLFYLIDMTSAHDDLRSGIGAVGRTLAREGVDVNVGLGLIGSRPRDLSRNDPPDDPTYSDPDGRGRRYQRPRLFRLARRIGPADRAFNDVAADALVPETYSRFTGDEYANLRPRGQWIGLDQLMTGSGVHDHRCDAKGRCVVEPTYDVPPGQVAGWRQDPGVRRVIVVGTPGEFDLQPPPGSPPGPAVLRRLVDDRVKVIGMSFRSSSWEDLRRVVAGTGAISAKEIDCGATHPSVHAGEPILCGSDGDTPKRILEMLRALPDNQMLDIGSSGPAGLVQELTGARRDVDVTVDQRLSFAVTFSCVGRPAGDHQATITARLRGSVVATALVEVACGGGPPPAPSAPPSTLPAPSGPAAPQVPQLPPPAPATPVHVAQPTAQIQVNPVLREHQAIQLALAQVEAAHDEAPPVQLAMSRRRVEERHAVASLLMAVAMASALYAVVEARQARRVRGQRARRRIAPIGGLPRRR
jgi:hypothetical protein